jgi:hypothetical protein
LAGALHPLLPAADLLRQLQQPPPPQLRLPLQLQPLPPQPLLAIPLLLLLQQGLLAGVGAQEGFERALQPALQVVQPGAAAPGSISGAASPGARVISGASISTCSGVIAASRERSSSWVRRATAPSPSCSSPIWSKAFR